MVSTNGWNPEHKNNESTRAQKLNKNKNKSKNRHDKELESRAYQH